MKPRRPAAQADSEAAFQRQVLNLAEFYGWRSYHTHDSRRSQPGFPDLVLVRGVELIFAELKTEKGRVRPEQAEWIQALTEVAVCVRQSIGPVPEVPHPTVPCIDVYLWRPSDFDQINARLARGRTQLQPLYRVPTEATR